MKNALSFLTEMGSSLRLRQMSRSELKAAMDAAGVDEEFQQIVLVGDREAIIRKLKAAGDIVCMVMPDKPDDEGEDETPEEPNKVANF